VRPWLPVANWRFIGQGGNGGGSGGAGAGVGSDLAEMAMA